MKSLTLSSLLIFLLVACAQPFEETNLAEVTVAGQFVSHVEYFESADQAPGGKILRSSRFRVKSASTDIPLKPGARFGVGYLIKNSGREKEKVEVIWTLPEQIEMPDGTLNDQIKYLIEKNTDKTTYSTYLITEPSELLPGKWNLTIRSKRGELLSRDFNLVP